MANTIEMVVKLCDDDRKRLDAILTALKHVTTAPTKAETVSVVENTTIEEKTAPEEPTVPDIVPETTEEEPTYTVKDVQQKVLELTTQKGVAKSKVREIVKTYADKVQNIPPDKLGKVMQELNKLEG